MSQSESELDPASSAAGAGSATARGATPLASGCTWEPDTEPETAVSEKGICDKMWVKDSDTPEERALAKWAHDVGAEYSIGMERVAYTLAVGLDLPVPVTHLEEYEGKAAVIQRRVFNRREFDQARHSLMFQDILDRKKVWPLAVVFDLWLANIDRRSANLVIQPVPAHKLPQHATSATTWLVDHGLCGLWYPSKTDDALGSCLDVTMIPATDGGITDTALNRLRGVMPIEYRRSFSDLRSEEQREPFLDAIRRIPDDLLEFAVQEVPDVYFSDRAAELTYTFLRGRRDRISTLSREAFPF